MFSGLALLIGGCNFFENVLSSFAARSDQQSIQQPRGKDTLLDFDEEFGVPFYLDADLVQEFPLPDGTITSMVLIPGGEFIMGLNDEDPLGIQPAGNVRIAVNAFWLDQFMVTNAQYRAFLSSLDAEERQLMQPDSVAWAREIGVPWGIYFRDEGYDNYPVVCVRWHQAKRFAEWAGKRLPTEAEWEYAARSGVSGRIYPWDGIYSRSPISGEALANFAPGGDFALDGFIITSPVGAFPPNNFRLYDMAGNAAEWCEDSYFPSYRILKRSSGQLVTPVYRNENEPRKIVRGGSWASNDFYIGVGVRDYRFSNTGSPRVGFRGAKAANNPVLQQRARDGYLLRTQHGTDPNLMRN